MNTGNIHCEYAAFCSQVNLILAIDTGRPGNIFFRRFLTVNIKLFRAHGYTMFTLIF